MEPQWGGSVTGCSNLSRTGQSVRLGVEWQLPHFMPHCNFFRPPLGSFRTKQLGGCWVGAHLLVKTDISGTPKKNLCTSFYCRPFWWQNTPQWHQQTGSLCLPVVMGQKRTTYCRWCFWRNSWQTPIDTTLRVYPPQFEKVGTHRSIVIPSNP